MHRQTQRTGLGRQRRAPTAVRGPRFGHAERRHMSRRAEPALLRTSASSSDLLVFAWLPARPHCLGYRTPVQVSSRLYLRTTVTRDPVREVYLSVLREQLEDVVAHWYPALEATSPGPAEEWCSGPSATMRFSPVLSR